VNQKQKLFLQHKFLQTEVKMNKPKYLYKSEEFLKVYEFVSEGLKGNVKKVVQFTETGTQNVFNLAFGDFNDATNLIDDLSITNNGDSLKVLTTVASIVYAFTEKYPDAWIFATGSTNVRTRLYRMGITNNLVEIKEDFEVYGLTEDGNWAEFITGEDYEAFLITKKR
jgi:hypothetical protein